MSFRRILLLLVVVWCQIVSKFESQYCLKRLAGPEIQYDFDNCSIVLDWNRSITSTCMQLATGYDVQYTNGCTLDGLTEIRNQTNHENSIQLPEKIPRRECSVNTNCYARVRFLLNGTSWSEFSAWTTLSNNYEATQTCVMTGADICFRINANCDNGILPEFIINRQLYYFTDIYYNFSTTHFDVTYNHEEISICIRNISTNIRFIEYCPLHSTCTSFLPSDDGELVVVKTVEIDVQSDVDIHNCTICDTPPPKVKSAVVFGTNIEDSLYIYDQKRQCVVVDFSKSGVAIQSWIINSTLSRENVCYSIESQQDIKSSVINLHNQIEIANESLGYMRSIAQYQPNSSYCRTGYFETSPNNNETIALIFGSCSPQNPTSETPILTTSSTTPGPSSHNVNLIGAIVGSVFGMLSFLVLLTFIIILGCKWCTKRKHESVHLNHVNQI